MKTLPRGFLKDDQTEDLNKARENKAFLDVEEHEDGLIIPMKELEKQAIWAALNKFGKDTEGKKKAAKALGIDVYKRQLWEHGDYCRREGGRALI